jgi:hypothetical protein
LEDRRVRVDSTRGPRIVAPVVDFDASGTELDLPPARLEQHRPGRFGRAGDTFHPYFAGQTIDGKHYNTPHATFWTFVGEALPHLGAHAFENEGRQPVWAPAVAQIDATHWMLYYAAKVAGAASEKCIWRAHAATADGPFVDDFDGAIECSTDGHWSIDPYLVTDMRGVRHLAARIDERGGINTIRIRDLDSQARSYAPSSRTPRSSASPPPSGAGTLVRFLRGARVVR